VRPAASETWLAALVQPAPDSALYHLFLLNVVLQLFDGVATHAGLGLGLKEANPVLRQSFQVWGVGATLVLFKAFACGVLLLLYRAARQRVATLTLAALAVAYSACSLVPWLVLIARSALAV
jgi:Domain of unknown function (DUF5658)